MGVAGSGHGRRVTGVLELSGHAYFQGSRDAA